MRRQWLVTLIVVGLMLSGCIGPEFQDLDEDGIEDSEDLDMDGDGWDNLVEIDCNSDPNNFDNVPNDLDNDTVCDELDEDIDGDNLPNDWELSLTEGFNKISGFGIRLPARKHK